MSAILSRTRVIPGIRASATSPKTAGEAFWGDKDTTHWLENKGTEPALLIVADIFKQS
jgi:hypothetical protein